MRLKSVSCVEAILTGWGVGSIVIHAQKVSCVLAPPYLALESCDRAKYASQKIDV
jgi:hypothetical protein